jgi:hypothetical protein
MAPSQSSCEKATPVSRNHRRASKVMKPPACPQTITCRSLREASARVRKSGGVSCGPSRMTSRLLSTRIAGLQSAGNVPLELICVVTDRFDHFQRVVEAPQYPRPNVNGVVSGIEPEPHIGVATLSLQFIKPAYHRHRFGAVECRRPPGTEKVPHRSRHEPRGTPIQKVPVADACSGDQLVEAAKERVLWHRSGEGLGEAGGGVECRASAQRISGSACGWGSAAKAQPQRNTCARAARAHSRRNRGERSRSGTSAANASPPATYTNQLIGTFPFPKLSEVLE